MLLSRCNQFDTSMFLYQSNTLNIAYNFDLGAKAIEFVFKGQLTEEAALDGALIWLSEFEKSPYESFTLIWNCQDMTGFTPKARDTWFECVQYQRRQIKNVMIAAETPLIRGTITLMMRMFGITHSVVKSFNDSDAMKVYY